MPSLFLAPFLRKCRSNFWRLHKIAEFDLSKVKAMPMDWFSSIKGTSSQKAVQPFKMHSVEIWKINKLLYIGYMEWTHKCSHHHMGCMVLDRAVDESLGTSPESSHESCRVESESSHWDQCSSRVKSRVTGVSSRVESHKVVESCPSQTLYSIFIRIITNHCNQW